MAVGRRRLPKRCRAQALGHFRAKRYKGAIEAFLAANDLYPSAAISFNVARAYDKLGDAPAALRFYRDYLRRDPTASDAGQIRERVEQLEDQLRLKDVRQVTIRSRPSGAMLSVDGSSVGITPWTGEIHPGPHKLQIQQPGFQSQEESFELSRLRALDLDLELEPAPEPAPAPEATARAVTAVPSAALEQERHRAGKLAALCGRRRRLGVDGQRPARQTRASRLGDPRRPAVRDRWTQQRRFAARRCIRL